MQYEVVSEVPLSTATFSILVERLPDDPNGSAPKTLAALRPLDETLSLGDVKAIAQLIALHLPCVIASGIGETRARKVADALNRDGGAAKVEASAQRVPLVVRPLT